MWSDHILALIDPASQAALDAHDRTVRAPLIAALEKARHAFIEGSPTLCIIEDALRTPGAEEKPERR